jgi:Nuclease-related domain
VAYDARQPPAVYVTHQAERRRRFILAGFGTYMAVGTLWVLLAFAHAIAAWSLLVAAVAFLAVRPAVDGYFAAEARWRAGAIAERAVGQALNELRRDGWFVLHDIRQRGEGNVDHLVSGPGGVFMIETKLRRYEDVHLPKARRQAAKLHDQLGVWVTPVIALHQRDSRPFRTHNVWVVPRVHLCDWLRAQTNPQLEFERLARFADDL